MAFKKIGDNMPIDDCFDSRGKKLFCPKCGSKLTTVSLESDNVEPICEECMIDYEDE